ncbi:hypothetical protein [Algibacter sp. 2305UL17-15]|uniref:hypothetical protein n=1 Tax=Algibacter sp. 2305UL17-15 TaxID=3231268 RepID=UPI0034583D6B
MYDYLIKKLTKGLTINKKIENEKYVYIFLLDDNLNSGKTTYKNDYVGSSGPLIINKLTKEAKFISLSELFSDEYFDYSLFSNFPIFKNEEDLISRIIENRYINPDDFFDIAKLKDYSDFILEIDSSDTDKIILKCEKKEIKNFFLSFLLKISADVKILDDYTLKVNLLINSDNNG